MVTRNTDRMSKKYEKLKGLLKELFQLDKPDLDFGLYRVMHAKSDEVSQFLDEDLLPQVRAAFDQYKTADKAELEKELSKVIAGVEAGGINPDNAPKVKELRTQLQGNAVDIAALESEVYDHLYTFFRRYYSEGDFLAKRVYKPGVYAIPYEGEEVTLHWANKDQYYIKTSEYLRDYAFRLRPDNEKNPMRVHFRLADAREGEHGSVKSAEGKNRVFTLAAPGDTGHDFIAEENSEQGKELVVRFEYRPATLTDWPENEQGGKKNPPKQKDLITFAAEQILTVPDPALTEWITELGKPHTLSDGKRAEYSRLEAHLNRYTARNTFDYFIHKDLGTFLCRELDFYIKNEVMHLDDVENESAPRVEQYLSKIKVIRRTAGKIIDFLAQLEDFQKKLWLKRKFVVETRYCITVGNIPEEFYPEIASNNSQHEEWVNLFSIDKIKGDLTNPAYSEKLKPEFLKANPTLIVDTRHFDLAFTTRLLEAIDNVDEQTDGVVFHSENFQALSLMQARYHEKVKCIYIDPPYNTGSDDFAYKDSYQHSSWMTMMAARFQAARVLSAERGGVFVSTDDGEYANLKILLDESWGGANFVADVIWNSRKSVSSDTLISLATNHTTFFAASKASLDANKKSFRLPTNASKFQNPDNDPQGPWTLDPMDAPNVRENLTYAIVNPVTGQEFWPPSGRCWRFEKHITASLLANGRIVFGRKSTARPQYKRYLSEAVERGLTPTTLWDDVRTTTDATKQLLTMFGESVPRRLIDELKPKPNELIQRCVLLLCDEFGVTLDYFAGSGTTGDAVINLNREDGSRRKFILVEIGDYFDTVLLPRIKKVTFTPEWKDGKPKRLATPEEAERSPRIVKIVRLESYEDTLNNLETHRTERQQLLLDTPEAKAADGLKEQYILRYMLNVETRGSQSLLNVQAFVDPTAYKLKVKRPGSDESREVNVDLLETFNWLIGLTVRHIAAPQTFNAEFERDSEGRLRLIDRLKQNNEGLYWFRTVTGTMPDGRRTLVIWRKLTGKPEEDNLVLDEWFTRQGYSAKDSEFDLIYVNGGNNLENLKTPDDLWKVRLIEEDFHRLMFEMEEV